MTLNIKSNTNVKLQINYILSLALGASLMVLGWLPFINFCLLIGFGVVLYVYLLSYAQQKSLLTTASWLFAVAVGLVLAVYRPTSFNYPLIFSVEQLHAGGLPFELRINTSKLIAGWLVIFVCIGLHSKTEALKSERLAGRQILHRLLLLLLVAVGINSLAYLLLDLSFHLKPLELILPFILVNLLVTCVAEEAFVRLLIQAQLIRWFKNTANWVRFWLPLVLTTALFLLVHGELTMALYIVYGLAGLCYGLVYALFRNVWYSIFLHALVNCIHFSFITYPIVV